MKRLRWQLVIVILALVAIGIILLGQQPDAQPSVGGLSTPQPAEGGIYIEALVGTPGRLNPLLDFYNESDRAINQLVYSSLLKFNDRGVPQLELAESMGVSQDGQVYNFSIRKDAVWHDGFPVSSQDVLFTVDLIKKDELPIPQDLSDFWRDIEVEALDESLLQFRLPEPFSPFLDYLTFGILPAHLLDGIIAEELIDSDFNLHPVGSGPYKFDQFFVDEAGKIQGLVLSAFDDYYLGRPFINQIVFRYYANAKEALQAYKNGDVLGISAISNETLLEALDTPGLNLYTGRLPKLSIVFLNLDSPEVPYFQDPQVRKALLLGLNRQLIVDRALGGQAIVADSPILPGTWAYNNNNPTFDYDPESAIEILKEAGYTIPAEGGEVRVKEGQFLSFTMYYPTEELYSEVADIMIRNWARIGVEVVAQEIPYDVLLDEYLIPRTYQAALVDMNFTRYPDPDPYPFWHQAQITGGQNYSKWDDRPASEYLEQARVTVDLAERTRLYGNFQIRFSRELPALPLFYPVYTYGVDETVLGVSMGPLFDTADRLLTIRNWYFREETINPETESPVQSLESP